jgi:Flp pilus assembly protein CpaB
LWTRIRLRRREVLWWTTAIALATVSVISVAGALDRADAAADRWGPDRPVLVATESIEIGRTLGTDQVGAAEWPIALVPPDAVVGPAEGRVAVAAIAAGEVLVESRLAPDGLTGAAALLPPRTRALAVPQGPGGLSLRPGDLVDVIATADPFALDVNAADGPATGAATRAVAAGATVVAVGEDSTTIAVPLAQLDDVAAALGQGVVTLALASPLDEPTSRS